MIHTIIVCFFIGVGLGLAAIALIIYLALHSSKKK